MLVVLESFGLGVVVIGVVLVKEFMGFVVEHVLTNSNFGRYIASKVAI